MLREIVYSLTLRNVGGLQLLALAENKCQVLYDMNHLRTLVHKTITWIRSATLGIWF